jgi:hypothetical protein
MKSIKLRTLPLLLFIVCMLLAACGETPSGSASGTQGQGGSSNLNPCSLLTKTQAETLLGATIAQPTSRQLGPTINCSFGPKGELNFLTLTVFDHNYSKSQFQAELKSNEILFKGTATSISGVGDEAYYIEGLLNVLKGDKYFIVSLVNPALDEPGKLEKLKQAANQIIGNL